MQIISHIIRSIKKLFFIGLLSVIVTPTSAQAPKPTQKTLPSSAHHWQIQHWKTPSGVPVYFIETHVLPMVDIQVVFKAGAAYDGKQYGLANLTNNLLNQGTKHATEDQIAEQWDLAGAIYNASVSRDMAAVGIRSLTYPKQFALALSTFKDVLSHPLFPVEAFERTRNQIAQMQKQQEQNPEVTSIKLFFKTLYGQHPYAHPTIGEAATLADLNIEAIQKFYQKYYVANNAMIAMVGNLSLEEAKKVSDEITAGLNKGQPAEKIPPVNKNGAATQHFAFPSNQTHLLMGQIALSRSDPDYFPFEVANHIFGGGINSRLFKTVRGDQGLAYNVSSGMALLREKGPFYINLQTEGHQKQKAVDLVKKMLLEFMEKGPSKAELDAAKHHLVQNFILELSSNQATLASLIDIGFYGLPLNYLSIYQNKIESVTAQQIEDALKKHLSPERFILITVGKDV